MKQLRDRICILIDPSQISAVNKNILSIAFETAVKIEWDNYWMKDVFYLKSYTFIRYITTGPFALCFNLWIETFSCGTYWIHWHLSLLVRSISFLWSCSYRLNTSLKSYCEPNEIESRPGNSKIRLLLKGDWFEFLTVGGIISQITVLCLQQFKEWLSSSGALHELISRVLHLEVVSERCSNSIMVCTSYFIIMVYSFRDPLNWTFKVAHLPFQDYQLVQEWLRCHTGKLGQCLFATLAVS